MSCRELNEELASAPSKGQEVEHDAKPHRQHTVTFQEDPEVAASEHSSDDGPATPSTVIVSGTLPPPSASGPVQTIITPDVIVFHKNPDEDDVGYKAVLEALTNPQIFSACRQALRTTAFVAFPMFTISIHPNTMYRLRFPHMVIAAVMAASTHRATLGEQIGVHTWTLRGITYMLVVGTIYDSWSLSKHIGAWWGLIALSIFIAGLCSNNNIRRFMFLYVFVYLMELRMFEQFFSKVPVDNASWMAADIYMGTMIGIVALLFPYPILTKTLLDMIIGKIFEGIGKMLGAMQSFIFAPSSHAAVLFFNDNTPFTKIEGILALLPALLWFTNWEPLEFPLRNPIRRLKLSLLRRIMALMYAAFSVGRTIVNLRKRHDDFVAMQKIRRRVFRRAREGGAVDEDSDGEDGDDPGVLFATMKAGYSKEEVRQYQAEKATLRENTQEHSKVFSAVLSQAIAKLGSIESKPEALLKGVPFDELFEKDLALRRNARMQILQQLHRQSEMVARNRVKKPRESESERDRDDNDYVTTSSTSDAVGWDSAHKGKSNAPFADGLNEKYEIAHEDAEALVEYDKVIDEALVSLTINMTFFHLLMSMIAGEIQTFGEMMKDYKPCKSLGRRLLDYFIFEPWHDFWEEVWFRLTLARPVDIRVIKDAFKMTSAFLSACAFNFELWAPVGGEYFFGTTILLGLPVEEESLNMGINRMAGNTLGCALGYLALHNCKNLSEVIGLAMCFVFMLQCCKGHPLYGQTFFYASVITMAGVVTSMITVQLLVRVLASTYTIMAYMLCCMFVFPSNPIKICWGYRIKLSKVLSEIFDDVAAAARMQIEYHSDDDDKDEEENEGEKEGKMNDKSTSCGLHLQASGWAVDANDYDALQMFSSLNVQVQLANRMLAMCVKWTPFAARQPVMRGIAAFPEADSKKILDAHQRLVANMRLLVFGVQLVHRPRSQRPDQRLNRLLSSTIADFLEEFADASRVVFQDFIDSIQLCRKWSYPMSLMKCSKMLTLKVRLHAIMHETYILLSVPLTKGTFSFDNQDLQMIRDEDATRKAPASGDYPVERQSSQRDASGGRSGAATPRFGNASFAERVLQTRREAATIDGDDSESITSRDLHQSMYGMNEGGLPSARGKKSLKYSAQLTEAQVAPSGMFPIVEEDVEGELAATLRKEYKDQEQQYQQQQQQRQRLGVSTHNTPRSRSARSSLTGKEPFETGNNDDAADIGDTYEPRPPKKETSMGMKRISELVLRPAKDSTAVPLPPYRGPAFSYREDEHDLPVDTDFLALVCILSSCESMLTELAAMVASVNVISGYQKQLHECSLALPLIDKMSTAIKAHRKSVYQRYHYPDPPPQKGGPINSQENPWQDWTF